MADPEQQTIFLNDADDPAMPSHWLRIGHQDALNGGAHQSVAPQFQAAYDDGYDQGLNDLRRTTGAETMWQG